MKADRASGTAEAVAAFRAMHTAYHGEPKILEDPYAIHLTNDRFRRLVSSRILHWISMRKHFYGWTYPLQAQVLSRARYTEDCLEVAIEDSVSQYVILGAGFDSFAWRRKDLLDRISVFELDHPATQRVKLARLAKAGLEIPQSLTCLPINMETESLGDRLRETSYSSSAHSMFSLLGTFPYLTSDAFSSTLREIARSTPKGSLLVFDFPDRGLFDTAETSFSVRKQHRATQRRGEPLISSLEPAELASRVAGLGWEPVEVLSPDDVRARYFANRTDRLSPFEHFHLACVRRVADA